MKKAVLVTLSVTTRVIVDVDDENKLSESEEQYAIEQAIDNVASNPHGYLTEDNLEKIEDDTEVPFGEGNSGSYDVFVNDIEWDLDEFMDGIEWDLDGDDDDTIELPKEVTYHLTEEEYKEYYEDPDYITDMLSDEFGFCVKSCSVEG